MCYSLSFMTRPLSHCPVDRYCSLTFLLLFFLRKKQQMVIGFIGFLVKRLEPFNIFFCFCLFVIVDCSCSLFIPSEHHLKFCLSYVFLLNWRKKLTVDLAL